MNRYRNAPGLRPPSKASPTTVCQKCLQRDKTIRPDYECKVSTQDRPYISRPSRTQQLANPRLRPQLSSDVPDDRPNTKGLADEQLAKRAEERGRKRDAAESEDDVERSRKRSRSASSYSSSSVSSISTRHSQSPSPPPRHDRSPSPDRSRYRKRKLSQSPSNGSSADDYVEEGRSRTGSRREDERRTRRRRNSRSPDERGRRHNEERRGSWRTRSRSHSMDKSRIAKQRRSLTPGTSGPNGHDGRSHQAGTRDTDLPSQSPRSEHDGRRWGDDNFPNRGSPPPPRERSLSPYSKRLALTQAMNRGQ